MQYACGECTLDMKVLQVDNKKYDFLLENDISPIPKSKTFDQFCNFVTGTYYKSRDLDIRPIPNFTLIGRLHKYSGDLPFVNCSETPRFTVESIKFGNGKWVHF